MVEPIDVLQWCLYTAVLRFGLVWHAEKQGIALLCIMSSLSLVQGSLINEAQIKYWQISLYWICF